MSSVFLVAILYLSSSHQAEKGAVKEKLLDVRLRNCSTPTHILQIYKDAIELTFIFLVT